MSFAHKQAEKFSINNNQRPIAGLKSVIATSSPLRELIITKAGEYDMTSKILGLLAVGLLASPIEATAGVVTWKATGKVTGISTSAGNIPEFASAAVGDPFTLTLKFDASSDVYTLLSGQAGFRYRYTDAVVSVAFDIAGAGLQRTNQGFTSIDILDDFSFVFSADPPADGISLIWGASSTQTGGFAQLGLIFRGPEYLDIFAGPGLPEDPSPLLTQLSIHQVQFIDGSDAVVGTVESVIRELPTPADQIGDLIGLVMNLNIQAGIGSSLDSKLQNALDALDRAQAGDTASATGILYAFIQSVEAQRGKQLTNEQADQLIATAQAVIDALSQT